MNQEVFFKQIREDLADYATQYPSIVDMQKEEWAFNFWILDKLYGIDENLIFDQIIDRHDKGIDCYAFDEESLKLSIIQNKYYDPAASSQISTSYIQDISVLPVGLLKQNAYTHSSDLQKLYNKYSKKIGFNIEIVIYISKELQSIDRKNYISEFNKNPENKNITLKLCDITDIYQLYYEDYSEGTNTNFNVRLKFSSNNQLLNIKKEEFFAPIHAKYLMLSVKEFYEMLDQAKQAKYNLFDENIRDYLGSSGKINSKIKETLLSPKDRKNFFYYNNGVTVVCKRIDKSSQPENGTGKQILKIENPKIVNGCQTVSTIFEVLKDYKDENENLDVFDNVYVMAKFLDMSSISKQSEAAILAENIVKCNNSQNSIDVSVFDYRKKELQRIQSHLFNKGFLMCIKQSDKNTYSNDYKSANDFANNIINPSKQLIDLFGLNKTKLKEYFINLDKFLQIVYCFKEGAYHAYTKKSKVVKNKKTHDEIVDYIISNGTLDDFVYLYLLFERIEQERLKKPYGNDRAPIPLYVIDFIAQYKCNRDISKLRTILDTKQSISQLVTYYGQVSDKYMNDYNTIHGVDYNKMIKQTIDYKIVNDSINFFDQMSKYNKYNKYNI